MLHDPPGWVGGWVAIFYTVSLSELSKKRVFCSRYLCMVIPYPRARYTVAKKHQGYIIFTLVRRCDFGGCEEGMVHYSIIPSQKVHYYVIPVEKNSLRVVLRKVRNTCS